MFPSLMYSNRLANESIQLCHETNIWYTSKLRTDYVYTLDVSKMNDWYEWK